MLVEIRKVPHNSCKHHKGFVRARG